MTNSRWRVEVVVMPKGGVSDPAGEAVKGGLVMLGHSGVARVRIGRHLELDVDASSADEAHAKVTLMAEQLLANPVIEQFEITNVLQTEPAGAVR